MRQALEPFDRAASASGGEAAYAIQSELQDLMQDNVGIVRNEKEMLAALEAIQVLGGRARSVAVTGNREYNPGWHTALDLNNLLTVSEAIARAGLERKESRGAHFREDFPDKDPEAAHFNIVIRRAADGSMHIRREPIPEIQPELQQIIKENQ